MSPKSLYSQVLRRLRQPQVRRIYPWGEAGHVQFPLKKGSVNPVSCPPHSIAWLMPLWNHMDLRADISHFSFAYIELEGPRLRKAAQSGESNKGQEELSLF